MKTSMEQLIREVQAYEKQRDRAEQCGRTTVQAVNCIVFNDIVHAGVVSHICRKRAGHVGDCECCKYHWKGGGR